MEACAFWVALSSPRNDASASKARASIVGSAAAISQGHGFLAGEPGQQRREGSQKKYVPVCRKRSASLEKAIRSITSNLADSLGQRNGCRAGPAICRQVAKQFVSRRAVPLASATASPARAIAELSRIADGRRKARAKQIRHGRIYRSGKRCVMLLRLSVEKQDLGINNRTRLEKGHEGR